MYDIVVFEILGIHTYTRKRKAGVFKNLNSAGHFVKPACFGARKTPFMYGQNAKIGKKPPSLF